MHDAVSVSRITKPGFRARNALSIVLLALFVASLAGQILSGRIVLNEERREHGQPALSWVEYLGDGQFVSATFEN